MAKPTKPIHHLVAHRENCSLSLPPAFWPSPTLRPSQPHDPRYRSQHRGPFEGLEVTFPPTCCREIRRVCMSLLRTQPLFAKGAWNGCMRGTYCRYCRYGYKWLSKVPCTLMGVFLYYSSMLDGTRAFLSRKLKWEVVLDPWGRSGFERWFSWWGGPGGRLGVHRAGFFDARIFFLSSSPWISCRPSDSPLFILGLVYLIFKLCFIFARLNRSGFSLLIVPAICGTVQHIQLIQNLKFWNELQQLWQIYFGVLTDCTQCSKSIS